MNDAVKALLSQLGPVRTAQDEDNVLQEIIQRIALLGLHRAGFFEKGAFYGGTALRILYGLDRFSEDLDFCLTAPDPAFTLAPYFSAVEEELQRFDLEEKYGIRIVIPAVEDSRARKLLIFFQRSFAR